MIICSDFAKSMSLPFNSKNTVRFLTLVKQKFDRLPFLHHLPRNLSQVLDQKYFAAPKELLKFSLVTIMTIDGLADSQKQFLLHL